MRSKATNIPVRISVVDADIIGKAAKSIGVSRAELFRAVTLPAAKSILEATEPKPKTPTDTGSMT